MAGGEVPGEIGTPVVPDDVEPVRPGRVGQREHVPGQVLHRVLAPPPGLRAGRVPALVRCERPVPGGVQCRRDPGPAVPVLRKPVQQDDHGTVGRPGIVDVEPVPGVGEAIDGGPPTPAG